VIVPGDVGHVETLIPATRVILTLDAVAPVGPDLPEKSKSQVRNGDFRTYGFQSGSGSVK